MLNSSRPYYSRTSSVLHWLIVNIRNNNIHSGEVKSSYMAPNPKLNENDQCTFLVYKQNTNHECIIRSNFLTNNFRHRENFNLDEFERNNNLQLFVVNFFNCQRPLKKNSKPDLQKLILDPKLKGAKKLILQNY